MSSREIWYRVAVGTALYNSCDGSVRAYWACLDLRSHREVKLRSAHLPKPPTLKLY